MGELIGELFKGVGGAIKGIKEFTRDGIADAFEEFARGVRKGDVIPQRAIDEARKNQERIDSIRDSLPE